MSRGISGRKSARPDSMELWVKEWEKEEKKVRLNLRKAKAT